MAPRSVKFLTILLFFISLIFYLQKLAQPSLLIWDERHHVPAAQSYLTQSRAMYSNLRNPPLGKEFIAASISLLGRDFFAYRLPSAIAASVLCALLFYFGIQLSGKNAGGILAAGLWLTSTLAYLHARLAMLDMITSLFFTAGLLAFLQIFKQVPASRTTEASSSKILWLYLACFTVAWGGTVKVLVYFLFPLFFLGLVLHRKSWNLRDSLPNLFFAALVFSLMALIFSYGILGYQPLEIPGELWRMYRIQSEPHRDYESLSTWYEWFIFRGSHWYSAPFGDTGHRLALWCANNPVLWAPGTLSVLGLLYFGWKKRNLTELLMAAAIPLQIIFWVVFKSQTILYYGLPMEPIFCLTIPIVLSELSKKVAKPGTFFNVWTAALLTASLLYFLKHFAVLQGKLL